MFLAYFFLSYLGLVSTFNLPSPLFLGEFAKKHSRKSITVHTEKDSLPKWTLWVKQYQKEQQMPLAITTENMARHYEGLHVFIPRNWSEDILRFGQFYSERTRASREHWLLDITLGNGSIDEIVKENLKDLPLDLDDDLFLFKNIENKLTIWEIYEIHPTRPRKLVPYATWTEEKGTQITAEKKWRRRSNLEGINFKVLSRSASYYSKIAPIPGKDGEFELSGMFGDVFNGLGMVLNFTSTVKKARDGTYGSLKPNGSWGGMIGEVMNQESDIAVASFSVTLARAEVITYMQPLTMIAKQLFIQNPKETYNLGAYTSTLTRVTWGFVALFCLVAPVFLFAATHLGQKEQKCQEYTWGKSVVLALGATSLRGWNNTPNKISSRIAFISIMMTGFAIYLLWEAMLISYLSLRTIRLPFTDLTTLLSTSDYKIGLMVGSSHENTFRYTDDPLFKRAWTERIEPYLEQYKNYKSGGDGNHVPLSRIPMDFANTALYHPYSATIGFEEFQTCKIIALPAKYNIQPYAMVFQKDSPYLPLFNHYVNEMREKGALQQIMKHYQPDPQDCGDDTGRPLGFNNCITAFLVPIAGMILAMILFLIETVSVACGVKIPMLEWYGCKKKEEKPQAWTTPEPSRTSEDDRAHGATPHDVQQEYLN